MQEDVISPGSAMTRIVAFANRDVSPDCSARKRIEFVIDLIAAFAIFTFAFVPGNRESILSPVGIGLVIGLAGYCISRIAYGRRVFFARQWFAPSRLVTTAFVLTIPVSATFFPEFLDKLYDAVWFLIAIGSLAAMLAVEGLLRKEWEH